MNIKTNLNNILNLLLEKSFDLYNIHWILIFYLIFIGIIVYLVLTDNRFKTNRKILFTLIIIILLGISFYINKTPYKIIKDLFWYSLILNASFIFHTLICDRIFYYCWKNHYEYAGFLISRLSFILSLSGVEYLINKSYGLIIPNLGYNIISKTILKIILIIKIILIQLSTNFNYYCTFLLGNNNIIKENLLKKILWFLLFFSIAIYLNTPRLYIIWIFQIILETYNILNFEYQYKGSKYEFSKLTIIEKIKFLYKKWGNLALLPNMYNYKYENLEKTFEAPYNKFFMFDLFKFRHLIWEGEYGFVWSSEKIVYEDEIYPIKKIFTFYPWKELAIGYCKVINKSIYDPYDDNYIRPKKEQEADILFFSDLVNIDSKLIAKEIFLE